MFARHEGGKTYACIVLGTPKPLNAVCTAWLTKDAAHARVHISAQEKPGAKRIETAYQVQQKGAASLLQVVLHTGRTHQIRAHMAFLGHPILGDDVYGNHAANRQYAADRLMLRAVSLELDTQGALPQCDGKALNVPIILDEFYKRINDRSF